MNLITLITNSTLSTTHMAYHMAAALTFKIEWQLHNDKRIAATIAMAIHSRGVILPGSRLIF